MTAKTNVTTVKQRGPRIKGICADSAALGCSRQHLWACLKSRRFSPRTLERYRALKASQNLAAANPTPNP